MPTSKASENFRSFLCSWGFFNTSFAQRLHQLKFSKLLVNKCSNFGVPSPSSPQSLVCVSSLHLPSPPRATLDYYFLSTHQKKMILVNRISGVKLSTGGLWEAFKVKQLLQVGSFQQSSKDSVFPIPVSDPCQSLPCSPCSDQVHMISQTFPLETEVLYLHKAPCKA